MNKNIDSEVALKNRLSMNKGLANKIINKINNNNNIGNEDKVN